MSTMTDTKQYAVTRDVASTARTHDVRTVAGPFASADDAWVWLLHHQGQSVHYATTEGGYSIVEIAPWSPDEAKQHAASAREAMRGDREHRIGHPGDTGDALRIVRENCSACVLAGYGEDDDDGPLSPNYGAWARIYVESGTPIPARYRAAFEAELHDENAAYAVALARSVLTFGVTFA